MAVPDRSMPCAGSRASPIDLRSDTVTQPTEAMYESILKAPLGDDGLDGDPTAVELECSVAALLGKEAALFVPSATMGNLVAILAQTTRQDVVAMEASSHIYIAERAAATLTGAFYEPIAGTAGAMSLDRLEYVLTEHRGRLKTGLVCMETSHNNAGGTALSLAHMREVFDMSKRHGASVHLDGARLFNAAVALRVTPDAIAACTDTVTICLSKGLSAPMGGVLAGANSIIGKARAIRKMLGGTQRQVGIAAAAGLVAINSMVARLDDDHRRAALLSQGLNAIDGLTASHPQTNIVQVDVSATGSDATHWAASLGRMGVLVRPWSRSLLRCVTHRHLSDGDVEAAVQAFTSVNSNEADAA
ncbi:GntG family PLP-dependent aldolase [Polaromonas sp. YR568]|uniref:threonine aldolase family protein n=1 Tax=Polaromonas sp. YR568 TaxID=1855301 RepID=UPI003137BF7C